MAKVAVDFKSGKLAAERLPGLLFGPHEPHFGSGLLDGDTIYLYGQIPGGCNIGLAKVPKESATNREAYKCWSGSRWCKTEVDKPTPVYSDMQQGAIVRSTFFGTDTPYVFLGNNKWADSKIRIGRSKSPQGPWKFFEVTQVRGIDHPEDYMYCIYPHFWAPSDKEASLMVTWSEHFPGGVVAGELQFKFDRFDKKKES